MAQPNLLPVFTALGQPTRWRTFELLLSRADGMVQGDIARTLGVEKNLLSVHLRVLREAGLVTAEKKGREVTYRVIPHIAESAARSVLDVIGQSPGD